jgi:hypothetical protein
MRNINSEPSVETLEEKQFKSSTEGLDEHQFEIPEKTTEKPATPAETNKKIAEARAEAEETAAKNIEDKISDSDKAVFDKLVEPLTDEEKTDLSLSKVSKHQAFETAEDYAGKKSVESPAMADLRNRSIGAKIAQAFHSAPGLYREAA